MKVLIVENESSTVRDLKSMLAILGHEVVDIVSTGKEAISRTANSHPDLVMINIQLKGSMSGVEAGKKITDDYGVPVIFITVFTKNCLTKSLQLPENAITISIPIKLDHLKYNISQAFPS